MDGGEIMGIDVLTLSKSKKYTDMVALGLSSAVVDDTAKVLIFEQITTVAKSVFEKLVLSLSPQR